MNTKPFFSIFVATALFTFAGCGLLSEQSLPSFESSTSENSQTSLPQDTQAPQPDAPTENTPSTSSEGTFEESVPSNNPIIEAPSIPSSSQLESLDFSVMSKEDLVVLLQPILDKAKYFCRFGLVGELDDVEISYNPETAIQRPYRNNSTHTFYPYLNLPYHTVEDLKHDMCTVFTPDNLDGNLSYIFNNMIDFDGKIYFPSDVSGYSVDRRWELENMEIIHAEKTKLALSMPVSYGPSDETIFAPLNFELIDGHIVMDKSYFASNNS